MEKLIATAMHFLVFFSSSDFNPRCTYYTDGTIVGFMVPARANLPLISPLANLTHQLDHPDVRWGPCQETAHDWKHSPVSLQHWLRWLGAWMLMYVQA